MNNNYVLGLILIVAGLVLIVSGSLLGLPLLVFGILFQLKGQGKITRIFYQPQTDLIAEGRALRSCISAYWIILVLAMLVSAYEETTLPLALQQFEEAQMQAVSPLIIALTLGFMLVNLIGSVGVYLLQPWGRNAFAAGLLGTIVSMPFFGPVVLTPAFGTLDEILSGLSGIILYLLYISPAKEYFKT